MVTTTADDTAVASSADGRTFRLRGLPRLGVPGDLVVLHIEDGAVALGQLLSARVEDDILVRAGSIIGMLDAGRSGRPRCRRSLRRRLDRTRRP